MAFSFDFPARLEKALPVGYRASDPATVRQTKSAYVATMLAIVAYFVGFSILPERTTLEATIDVCGAIIFASGIVTLHWKRDLNFAYTTVVLTGLLLFPAYTFLHGNKEGEFFFIILIPASAIAFVGVRRSVLFLVFALAAACTIVIVDPYLPQIRHDWHVSAANPEGWLFHSPDKVPFRPVEAATFFSITLIIYALLYASGSALRDANRKVESLLLNVLPKSIAGRLMEKGITEHGGTIVDSFDQVSILFADIVGFTQLTKRMRPGDLVMMLNTLFSEFDRIASAHDVEKIKTIGDAYMAVCGLPEPNDRHAEQTADMALEMLGAVKKFNRSGSFQIGLRIGINSGPVVAGVIGRDKFIYDLWGDAVNMASRMESNGSEGLIQTTKATRDILKDRYEFESLGEVDVRGQGLVPTWRLMGRTSKSRTGRQ